MRIEALNEKSSIIYLGDVISDEVSARVSQAATIVRQSFGPLLTDVVPSYTSLLLYYDCDRIDHQQLHQRLIGLLVDKIIEMPANASQQVIEVPVYYGTEVALDLQALSDFVGLTPAQVISIHSKTLYRAYAIGFTPGFAYLGTVSDRIAMPRMPQPRLRVPSGSVAIADSQTAIYPSETPGGWRIIGKTPMQMIDWGSDRLMQIAVGMQVRFCPIDRQTFVDLGGELQGGEADEF